MPCLVGSEGGIRWKEQYELNESMNLECFGHFHEKDRHPSFILCGKLFASNGQFEEVTLK